MDDSYANPMRTGLMFVPLGLAMSPSDHASSQRPEWAADFDADTAGDAPAPAVAPIALRRGRLGWLATLAAGLLPRPRRSAG